MGRRIADRQGEAPEDTGGLRGWHVLVVQGVEQAEAEDRAGAERCDGRPETLAPQRFQLVAGVHPGEVDGVQHAAEVESLRPGGIGKEVGVEGVRPVHQHHRIAAAEVLEAEELAKRQDALVAGEQGEAAGEVGKEDGQTGHGHRVHRLSGPSQYSTEHMFESMFLLGHSGRRKAIHRGQTGGMLELAPPC